MAESEPSGEERPGRGSGLTQAHVELINSGFRPARHGGVVRLVRRLLWPFIRAFHFFTLEWFQSELDAMHRALSATDSHIADLRHRVSAELPHLFTEDLKRLVLMHSVLRSEQTSLLNRHVWLEDQARQALVRLETIEDRQETMTRGHAAAAESAGADRVAATEMQQRLAAIEDRLWQRETHAPLFLCPTRDGVFLLKNGELISEAVRRAGVWDEHILAVADAALLASRARVARTGPLRAVDAGAHFGLISVALARRFEQVISFEANSFNALLLTTNVAINGLTDRVEVRRTALAAVHTRVSLAPSERQEIPLPVDIRGQLDPSVASNLGAYSFVAGGTGMSEVDALPLDSLSLDSVAFIKVDVQGADGEVLMGSMDTVARCRPWLVFEWEEELSQQFSVRFIDVEAGLERLGYALRVLKRHNHKQVDYVAVPAEERHCLPVTLGEAAA